MHMTAGLRTSQGPLIMVHQRSSPTELDGCLTFDGLMPKLTLLHSRKAYRLQPKANLQKDDPLVFALSMPTR